VRRRAAAIEHVFAVEVAKSSEELVAEYNAQGGDRHEEHRRSSSHRRRAWAWHLGQHRDRQELYDMGAS